MMGHDLKDASEPRAVTPAEVAKRDKEWRGVEKQFINFLNGRLMNIPDGADELVVIAHEFNHAKGADIRHARIEAFFIKAGWKCKYMQLHRTVEPLGRYVFTLRAKHEPINYVNPSLEYRDSVGRIRTLE